MVIYAANNIWHFNERAAMLKIHCLTLHFPFISIHKGKFITQAFYSKMLIAHAMPTDPVPIVEILL